MAVAIISIMYDIVLTTVIADVWDHGDIATATLDDHAVNGLVRLSKPL